MTKRPMKRAKKMGECSDAELTAIREYCTGAHPSNVPEKPEAEWWTFDKEGRAGWIAGYIV